MSLLDKLSANVTNAGRIASQKVKNMSEANSLSTEQRNERNSIQRNLSEIGRLYYEKYKDVPDAEFAALISEIKASEQKIQELDAEIEAVRAREPELVPIPEDEEIRPAAQPTAKVCMQCGATYAVTETVCTGCGTELVAQYATAAEAAAAPQQTAEAAPEKPVPAEPVTIPLVNPAPKPPVVNGVPVIPAQVDPTPIIPTQVDPAPVQADPAPAAEEKPVPETSAAPEAHAAPEAAPAADAAPRFCAYCGKPCESGQVFCAQCGKKL